MSNLSIDPSVLLSEEFEEASKKLAELRAKKQEKTEEIKKIYDAFMQEITAIEEEAKAEWEKLMTCGSSEVEIQSQEETEEE